MFAKQAAASWQTIRLCGINKKPRHASFVASLLSKRQLTTATTTSDDNNASVVVKATPKICIVGSGPAAMYTAQYTLSHMARDMRPTIDILERLPVPFGLVRYGVAPDHQDVKNVINSFTQTLRDERVNYLGNVNIGVDVRLSELHAAYDCVVLAYGSHSENYLNVPGERECANVVSAKDIVSFYNGLPEASQSSNPPNVSIDFSGKRAIIVGAGNVAIDIARILLTPCDKLATTDISQRALDAFRASRHVEHVSIVARRGILNAAFTLKELRELTKIPTIRCHIDPGHFRDICVEQTLTKLERPRRRLLEFMYNLSKQQQQPSPETATQKRIDFVFLRTPIEIRCESSSNGGRVSSVRFAANKYAVDFSAADLKLDSEEALNALSVVAADERADDSELTMPAELVVRSIGYKNVNIDEYIPFDKKRGVVLNEMGRVCGRSGMYCTGWIKRGPRGVIVDTTSDAYETARQMCNDLASSLASHSHSSASQPTKRGTQQLLELLRARGVKYVDKEGWRRIDTEEKRAGQLAGKPREKLQSVNDMLSVANPTHDQQ